MPVGPRAARQWFARDGNHDGQQGEADEQPQRDERERMQPRVDPDLDEQVAAAPEEAQQDEEERVDGRVARVQSIILCWVSAG